MLIVSCTKCDGWLVVVADEHNDADEFLLLAKEEGRKPNRKITVTKDEYDDRAFGLTGACRSSTPYAGAKPDCAVAP